jgi:hypothetical protein
MKNEELQSSEALAKMFAARREEAPLLSAPEIEKLLARRDVLPKPSRNILRKSIMTLTGLTGIGAIIYFALFNGPNPSNMTHTSHTTYETNESHLTTSRASTTRVEYTHQQTIKQVRKNDECGPWSAGNDQYYADLTSEQLQKIGIFIKGDTIVSYRLNDKDSVEIGKVSYHYIQGYGLTKSLAAGIEAHHFFPELITFGNGNGAAWQTKDGGCAMIPSEINSVLGPWLKKPGTAGIHALGFENHVQYNGGVGYDTLRLMIGKNFAMPAPFPFEWTGIDKYWDSLKDIVMQLAHFYEGTASKPILELPKNRYLKVDTVTPQDLVDEIEQEQNSSTMEQLHSIVSRLNELIPVIVRMTPGTGEPSKQDFIFWYKPSEELFNALPAAQATIFRAKLNKMPYCMNAPATVTTSAEVTYCVSDPQEVQVRVFDLTGHIVMSVMQQAEAGDNIAKISTKSLPSGIYIVSVQEHDGSQRARRIWVQNAH